MLPAPIPANEAERLARLRELFILDSAPEPVFDAIARMASQLCNTPVALISLVDGDRQWFKAQVGLGGVNETPRDISFCGHAIFDDSLFEVNDALADDRFADNPMVTGDAGVRFYVGAPLVMEGGERVGTLCVIDRQPRELTVAQGRMMRSLAAIASRALSMRRDLLDRAMNARTGYEAELTAATNELVDLYEHAPCGYHSIDENGFVVRVNETALRWMGVSRDELIGKLSMREFLTEDGRTVLERNLPRILAGETLENVQYELVGRDGGRRHVIATVSSVRKPDGSFLMTRTVTHDVTELQQARRQLRRLAVEQQAMLDTDLIGIVRLKDRHVTYANRGAEHLLGYGPGELLGIPARSVYADDESYQAIGRQVYSLFEEGKPFRTQMQMLRKDGRTVWVDVRGSELSVYPGEAICMLVDITPLRQAEETRVRAASLEAENRQLVESNRIKSLFLANMSHELHTPLNAVTGYLHLLQSGAVKPDSPKFADYLGKIGAGAKQLLGLIDSTLDFAKIESGKLELRPQAVHLETTVQQAMETLQGEIRARRVAVDVEVDPALGAVVTDEPRLLQVLTHFLSNAVKFSPQGSRISVRARIEDANRFRVEVEDQGIGISPSDIPRLFTAFHQLSEGNTKAYPGAGLGLALVKRLVEAQHGTVGVRSRPGEGSTFHCVLPGRRLARPISVDRVA